MIKAKIRGFAGVSGIFVLSSVLIMILGCPFSGLVDKSEETRDLKQQIPLVNISPTDSLNNTSQWNRINNEQAQKSCLKQVKKVAVDSGYPEGVVLSCKCKPQESANSKTYRCTVTTVDLLSPNKELVISCIKAANTCTVTSEGKMYVFSFDEMERFAN